MGDGESNEPTDPYPPEYDGPTVEIPRVDPPDVDPPEATSEGIADSPIATLFVLHVVIWNAVLLLLSLGVLLIYFEQNWSTGPRLIAAGAVLALYGAYRWPDTAD